MDDIQNNVIYLYVTDFVLTNQWCVHNTVYEVTC